MASNFHFALLLEYDGTDYCGYQVQPNGPTIQAQLERALKIMTKMPADAVFPTVASGRTDAGVHARGQVVHLAYPASIAPEGLLRALNSLLPPDIRVRAVAPVSETFHARYDATSKHYRFLVDTSKYPNPFKQRYQLHHPYRYQLERIEHAIHALIGTHDFTSFCAANTDKTDKVRTITRATVIEDARNHQLQFDFEGNGFLYHMVRIIVGTLLQIGDGIRPVSDISDLLIAQDRNLAGPTADGRGLTLMRVDYPSNPFDHSEAIWVDLLQ